MSNLKNKTNKRYFAIPLPIEPYKKRSPEKKPAPPTLSTLMPIVIDKTKKQKGKKLLPIVIDKTKKQKGKKLLVIGEENK